MNSLKGLLLAKKQGEIYGTQSQSDSFSQLNTEQIPVDIQTKGSPTRTGEQTHESVLYT